VLDYSSRSGDGSEREFLGCIDLLNDYAALAFGNDVIRDMTGAINARRDLVDDPVAGPIAVVRAHARPWRNSSSLCLIWFRISRRSNGVTNGPATRRQATVCHSFSSPILRLKISVMLSVIGHWQQSGRGLE
jgi:hypothetical protein